MNKVERSSFSTLAGEHNLIEESLAEKEVDILCKNYLKVERSFKRILGRKNFNEFLDGMGERNLCDIIGSDIIYKMDDFFRSLITKEVLKEYLFIRDYLKQPPIFMRKDFKFS